MANRRIFGFGPAGVCSEPSNKIAAGGKPSTWFPPGGTRRAGLVHAAILSKFNLFFKHPTNQSADRAIDQKDQTYQLISKPTNQPNAHIENQGQTRCQR